MNMRQKYFKKYGVNEINFTDEKHIHILKEFHTKILSFGSVGLDLLEEMMNKN